MDTIKLRSLSNIYNPSIFSTLIKDNDLILVEKKLKANKKKLTPRKNKITFADFISALYQEMLNSYRNEYIYKNAIINQKLLSKYSLKTTTLLSELKIGKSQADLVFINGEVKIFEIKTDLDDLQRLESQLFDYSKVAEKIYIVTNIKFITKLQEKYNSTSIGLIELTDEGKLITQQEAKPDISNFNYAAIFKILRKNEYLNIIQQQFGYIPNVPNTQIFKTCFELVQQINIVDFQKLAFAQLKKRNLLAPESLKDAKTPAELKLLCHTLNLTKEEYQSLYTLLEKTI